MRSKLSAFILGLLTSASIFIFSVAIAQHSQDISIYTHYEVPMAIQVTKGEPLLVFAIQLDQELILSAGGQVTGKPAKASFNNPDQIAVVAGEPASTIKVAFTSPLATPSLPDEVYKQEVERIMSEYLSSIKSLQNAIRITGQNTAVISRDRREQISGHARILKIYGKQLRSLTPSDQLLPLHIVLLDGAKYFDEAADIVLVEQVLTKEQYGQILENFRAGVDKLSEAVNMLELMTEESPSDNQ